MQCATNPGKVEKDPTYSANLSVKLEELCDSHRVPCELVYPGALNVEHATDIDFIQAQPRPDLNSILHRCDSFTKP